MATAIRRTAFLSAELPPSAAAPRLSAGCVGPGLERLLRTGGAESIAIGRPGTVPASGLRRFDYEILGYRILGWGTEAAAGMISGIEVVFARGINGKFIFLDAPELALSRYPNITKPIVAGHSIGGRRRPKRAPRANCSTA
jgi:hypothetical protein